MTNSEKMSENEDWNNALNVYLLCPALRFDYEEEGLVTVNILCKF